MPLDCGVVYKVESGKTGFLFPHRPPTQALMTMPTLLLYPIWSVLQLVLLVFYFLVVGVYLSTMEHVTTNQLAADVGFNATINEMVNTTFNSSLGGVGLVNWDTNLNSGLLWFHFFSFLWTANFINAIGICVIAGAVCQWYWILPGKDEKKKLPSRLPVISSVSYDGTSHAAPVCKHARREAS